MSYLAKEKGALQSSLVDAFRQNIFPALETAP